MEFLIYLPAFVLLIFGLIICYAGYNSFRLTVTVAGAAAGYAAGGMICARYGEMLGLADNQDIMAIIPIVSAVLLGIVAFALYLKALKLLVTAIVTVFFADSYLAFYGTPTGIQSEKTQGLIIVVLVGLAIGFVLGMLVKKLQRWAIILCSAAFGARVSSSLLASYFVENAKFTDIANSAKDFIFNGSTMSAYAFTSGVLLIVLFVTGLIVQSATSR